MMEKSEDYKIDVEGSFSFTTNEQGEEMLIIKGKDLSKLREIFEKAGVIIRDV